MHQAKGPTKKMLQKPIPHNTDVQVGSLFGSKIESKNGKANIYEYSVNHKLFDYRKWSVFKNNFEIKPWFWILFVNLIALILLIAIGFGISIGAHYGLNCNLFCFFVLSLIIKPLKVRS